LSSLATLLEALAGTGVTPIGLSAQQATLDDVFLQLTGRTLNPQNESELDPSAGAKQPLSEDARARDGAGKHRDAPSKDQRP
jgi:hypothetical protein